MIEGISAITLARADDCATLASRRALPPYRGRSFTGRIASASPDAPEPEVRIHFPPAKSPQAFGPCERTHSALGQKPPAWFRAAPGYQPTGR